MEQAPIGCLAVYSLSRSESFLCLVCISMAIITKLLHMTPSCLNQSVKQGLEFHLFSFIKSGMTNKFHNFISSSIQAGLCIQDIESMLLNLYSSHHSSSAYLYILKPHCPWIVMNSVIFLFLIQREIPSEEC